MSGRLGPWLVGAAMTSAALFAVLMDPSAPEPLGRGSPAPSFVLEQVGGGRVSLDELRGRVILLNFWATWCKPCEDEMPAMERLYRRLGGSDFELLAVSVDNDPALVGEFRERLGLSFPILLDPDQRVAADYQTYRFPESLVIDRDGRVIERYIGPKDWDAPSYLDRLQKLIAASS